MVIYIAALVKNCQNTLKKNIEFIIDYNKNLATRIKLNYILENDSIDDTKKILDQYSKNNSIQIFSPTGLEKKILNRIERITYCRNFILEKIGETNDIEDDFLYIPADFDIDLFSNQTIEEFNNVVNFVKNNDEVNAIFPNCIPYYYDIHALRRNGWNSKDSWKIYNKLSKYFPIGKFFLKYYLIYRKQIKIEKMQALSRLRAHFWWDRCLSVKKKPALFF